MAVLPHLVHQQQILQKHFIYNIKETYFFLVSKIISKLPNKILFLICELLGWWITHNNLQQRK